MLKVSEFFKGRKQVSDFEAADAEAAKALDAARERVAGLADQRRAMLITADDAKIETVEREIATAERDVDRLEAVRTELTSRRDAAEAAEKKAAIDAEYERVEAAHERGCALVAEYGELAASMRAVLAELTACEQRVQAWSGAGHADMPVFPRPDQSVRGGGTQLVATVVLPGLIGMDSASNYWPPFNGEARNEAVAEGEARLEKRLAAA